MSSLSKEQNTIFPEPFYFIIFSIKAESGSNLNIVKTLFSNSPGSVKSDFEGGFRLRQWGWDLEMPGGYEIDINGIHSENKFKKVQVGSSGQLIIQGALVPDFLCWKDGSNWEDQDSTRIHPLGLIEFTYNAVIAFNRIMKDITNPGPKVECLAGFVGLQADKHFLVNGDIRPGKVNVHTFPWKGVGESEFTTTFDSSKFNENQNDLGRITYEIIQKIYQMFGSPEENIPYVIELDGGDKIISVLQIKNT